LKRRWAAGELPHGRGRGPDSETCWNQFACRFGTRRDRARQERAQKQKGPTFVGPVFGIWLPLRTDPIPTAPGGWGLRNPEPKGPGQRRIIFSQGSGAGDGQKWGSNMILLTFPW